MRVIEGQLGSPSGRFAIVAARFNAVITGKLVDAAAESFARHGVTQDRVDLVWVPGSFEIPTVAQRLAASGKYVAVVCLGCVVRGDTDHYLYVAGEAARGIAEAGRATGVPVILGLLTTDTVEQALARAGPPPHNAGHSAAETAIRMANLMAQLSA
jgi:6,7-dimethyl-8-ribityllumazine synthase